MIKLKPEIQAITQLNSGRDCRPADTTEIINQIGRTNIMAITGTMKRVHVVKNLSNETCGVLLWLGQGRVLDVVLLWNDLYHVTRHRLIMRGEKHGQLHEEVHMTNVDCESLAEIVYSLSCWK
jgi:hypothetical protein